MINRVLIRIRVIQTLFAYYSSQSNNSISSENALLGSLEKSYELYFNFLQLLVDVTDEHNRKVENRKNKLLPTAQDMNPNVSLSENKFIKQLKANTQLTEHLKTNPFDWYEYDVFLRSLLDSILNSDVYKEYSTLETRDYNQDRDFWRKVFKQIVCTNETLYSILEDECIYWNDDVDIVQSFTIKSIKQFDEANGAAQELLPMYRDITDEEFATELLNESIKQSEENRTYIDKYTKNWDSERIASMDMIIMQTAIAEIKSFPSIPINVTLNEYINIAKAYSTDKSPSFINGILDSVVKELKDEKVTSKTK